VRTCVRDVAGSPATRFKRAIESRSLINAELAAREMGRLSLEHALALVVLYAESNDPRAERAMVRWLGRLFTERRMEFALAARCVELVGELRGPTADRAAEALTSLVRS
jgi:phage FluMu protein gp41